MPDELITPDIAAAQLGTSARTVRRWCQSQGIGRRVGNGERSMIVLTEADVETLRGLIRETSGNPGFGTTWKGRSSKRS